MKIGRLLLIAVGLLAVVGILVLFSKRGNEEEVLASAKARFLLQLGSPKASNVRPIFNLSYGKGFAMDLQFDKPFAGNSDTVEMGSLQAPFAAMLVDLEDPGITAQRPKRSLDNILSFVTDDERTIGVLILENGATSAKAAVFPRPAINRLR